MKREHEILSGQEGLSCIFKPHSGYVLGKEEEKEEGEASGISLR